MSGNSRTPMIIWFAPQSIIFPAMCMVMSTLFNQLLSLLGGARWGLPHSLRMILPKSLMTIQTRRSLLRLLLVRKESQLTVCKSFITSGRIYLPPQNRTRSGLSPTLKNISTIKTCKIFTNHKDPRLLVADTGWFLCMGSVPNVYSSKMSLT